MGDGLLLPRLFTLNLFSCDYSSEVNLKCLFVSSIMQSDCIIDEVLIIILTDFYCLLFH